MLRRRLSTLLWPQDQPITDWRSYNSGQYKKLDKGLRAKAVALLRTQLSIDSYRAAITKDPNTWWVPWHHYGGRQIRNSLRSAGFGEREFMTDNLDDYYVCLVEIAVMGDHYYADLEAVR